MTDSLLDAANPGGNEEALIASSKYLEKFDQLKRNQLGNENYNEDNKTLIDETTEVEPSNYNPEVINKDQIESDQYYKEKFQEPGRKDTKTSTPFLGLYDKLNIFTKDYGGEYAPEELRGQHRLRNSIGDLFRIADRGVISGTVGLTNTVNEKDCRVEVEFSIGSVDWKVVRGIKPNIFEIWKSVIKIRFCPFH